MNTATKNRVIRLSIFIAWFFFILTLFSTGKLAIFIRKSYAPLSLVAVIVIAGLIVNALKEKHEEASHALTWRFLLLFLFPLALALLARPDTLSTFAVAKRGITSDVKISNTELLDMMKSHVEQEGRYRTMTLKQALAFSKEEPVQANGMLISTEGLVLKNKDTGTDTFVLIRFLIFCCAVDATPLGIPVTWDKSAELKQDTWVRVNGKLVVDQNGAKIVGEEVTAVPQPSDPYLY
jgi:putative membrane protein